MKHCVCGGWGWVGGDTYTMAGQTMCKCQLTFHVIGPWQVSNRNPQMTRAAAPRTIWQAAELVEGCPSTAHVQCSTRC